MLIVVSNDFDYNDLIITIFWSQGVVMTHQLPYLRQPPFDSLSDTERERLTRHSQIVYLDS